MNVKTGIKRTALVLFLLAAGIVSAFADPAIVRSKQENLPHGRNNLKTRVFLDITPNNGDDRPDAYVDLMGTKNFISIREFGEMINVGDVIEYNLDPYTPRDGRYSALPMTDIVELNGRNIYEILIEDFQDSVAGSLFFQAQRAYEASRQR